MPQAVESVPGQDIVPVAGAVRRIDNPAAESATGFRRFASGRVAIRRHDSAASVENCRYLRQIAGRESADLRLAGRQPDHQRLRQSFRHIEGFAGLRPCRYRQEQAASFAAGGVSLRPIGLDPLQASKGAGRVRHRDQQSAGGIRPQLAELNTSSGHATGGQIAVVGGQRRAGLVRGQSIRRRLFADRGQMFGGRLPDRFGLQLPGFGVLLGKVEADYPVVAFAGTV